MVTCDRSNWKITHLGPILLFSFHLCRNLWQPFQSKQTVLQEKFLRPLYPSLVIFDRRNCFICSVTYPGVTEKRNGEWNRQRAFINSPNEYSMNRTNLGSPGEKIHKNSSCHGDYILAFFFIDCLFYKSVTV